MSLYDPRGEPSPADRVRASRQQVPCAPLYIPSQHMYLECIDNYSLILFVSSLFCQMAVCPEPILGIKWGTPGRLLPHMNGGLELIMLSAETACLHAVALSPDSVNK